MLLTITTTRSPATDLARVVDQPINQVSAAPTTFGEAQLFFPEAGQDRCMLTLMLAVDPVVIARNHRAPSGQEGALGQYINDRPYASSSFLSLGIDAMFGNLLRDQPARSDLAEMYFPLEARLPVLACRGGASLIQVLFEPLGYHIDIERHALDARFSQWGESHYYDVTLTSTRRVRDLLRHLYILGPALDDEKHYWMSESEIDLLLDTGREWLDFHPERDLIIQRFLMFHRQLTRSGALTLKEEHQLAPDSEEQTWQREEWEIEVSVALTQQRYAAAIEAIAEIEPKRALVLACGDGRFLFRLLQSGHAEELVGMETSLRDLRLAEQRLAHLPVHTRQRARLIQGALTYSDGRLRGFDVATALEVIEHLDPRRLATFERVLFERARPARVIVTTPNHEYNSIWRNLPGGWSRHRQHQFEWSRPQFAQWADAVAERFGYRVAHRPIGPEDPKVGAPTQMGVFDRCD